MTTWDGKILGQARKTGHFYGLHRTLIICYRTEIDEVPYYGRGLGRGMMVRLRRAKAQP